MNIFDYIARDENVRNFFRHLPPEEFQYITMQHFKKNDILFQHGNVPDSFYLVLEGICNCFTFNSTSVTPRMMHRLGYMDITGLHEVVHDLKRVGTVVAHTDATVAAIDGTTAHRWIEVCPRAMLDISTSITNRMYNQAEFVSLCTKYSTFCGVVSILLNEWEIFNRAETKNTRIRLQYTQQEIGEIVGKNVRSVNRVIRSLKEQGLIDIDNNKIYMKKEYVEPLLRLRAQEVENK